MKIHYFLCQSESSMPSRKTTYLLLTAALIFFALQPLCGQKVTYSHPLAEMGFQASPRWDQELIQENGEVYEVTHPNHNIRIRLRFIPDCRNPRKEMRRQSGLKGLVNGKRASDTVLNDKKAFLLRGMCLQDQLPYFRLMVGIPEDGGLYLLEICCPEDCYSSHRELVRDVLGTLTVGA